MIHALALSAALWLPNALPPAATAAGLSASEWAQASSGEAVVKGEPYKTADGKDAMRSHAWVVISASADACYATLHAYEKAPEFLPRVKKVTFLDKGDRQMRVIQEVKVVFSTLRYTMDMSFDPVAHTMRWTLDPKTRNDIKETSGLWKFVPLDAAHTLLDYTISVDTGMAVPRAISDYLTRKDLPDLLTNFKKRVESGGTWTK